MDIRPIHNEQDYEAALARINALMEAEPGSEASDELDILSTLVEAYEAEHHSIEAPDPVAAIKFRMEQAGLSRKDLEPYLGHSGRVAEVLNYKRGLSLQMIRRLHSGLGIPLESLIQPFDKAS
ncbi:HTH-type transcriptional regulator/antitoxin HigA [Natronospira proteinivora]|uniref:HTH-type transcriptional regulator/antitoxin HigA n=1 Tax=Natronospira proteinivora TaxID=1807133 RepID=A0ABT1G8L5_9GAMM|nr:transcriptional regulator [Natronospira proteinivora]MCP1727635.1 HTH-type transcriptional regulator/antitoxin HigA [Natronospira proteinivora]